MRSSYSILNIRFIFPSPPAHTSPPFFTRRQNKPRQAHEALRAGKQQAEKKSLRAQPFARLPASAPRPPRP